MSADYQGRRPKPQKPAVGNVHWTLGGTGITNFNFEDLPFYQKAIEENGNPNLYIELNAIGQAVKTAGVNATISCYSLHHKMAADWKNDLSQFWKLFEVIKRPK